MAIDAQLQALVDHPGERLDVELKGWLELTANNGHKGLLGKAAIALANHGGGFIVLGFESDGTVSVGRPATLHAYNQDAINGVINRYADPAIHCGVHLVRRIADGLPYPLIVVPGGHKVPVRSKRGSPGNEILENKIYVRRPGPQSQEPQNGHEWNELLERCMASRRDEIAATVRAMLEGQTPRAAPPPDAQQQLHVWTDESLARWQQLVDPLPVDDARRMPNGHYAISLRIDGIATTMPALQDAMRQADQTRLTGWPPWWWPTRDGIRPYVRQSTIECQIADNGSNSAHSDFWRVSDRGELFLIRGYAEDTLRNDAQRPFPPGAVFDLTLPAWRVGECLLFAERLANALGANDSTISVYVEWAGLHGRELVSLSGRRLVADNRIAHADRHESQTTVQVADITPSLVEIVRDLTLPLYALFDFFQPPVTLFSEELGRMQRREF